ncbi:unnamed protein product [Dovyalis caffra]|uniref:Uncharacterized protein n=1 Tax=Dovyalis caffra TaxID=77055 RepID=A0AAV1RJQ5_9ROSI|nr:unnamed protein product [Dovyalis caffra]
MKAESKDFAPNTDPWGLKSRIKKKICLLYRKEREIDSIFLLGEILPDNVESPGSLLASLGFHCFPLNALPNLLRSQIFESLTNSSTQQPWQKASSRYIACYNLSHPAEE